MIVDSSCNLTFELITTLKWVVQLQLLIQFKQEKAHYGKK